MSQEIDDDVDLLSDEEIDTQREEAEKDRLRLRNNELNDLRWLLEAKAGRNILVRFIERARVYHNSVIPNDGNMTHFNEGTREFGLWMLGELEAAVNGRDDDFKNFDKLMREYWRK